MRTRVLLVAAAALALSGCEQLLTRPIIYNTVRVEVVSRGGTPVPNARVELYTGARPMGYATTNGFGRAAFHQVPRAQYGVAITPPAGYARLHELIAGPPSDFVDGINLDVGADTTFRFTVARRGDGFVRATVKDQAGAIVPGLNVTLYAGAGTIGTKRSDAAGMVEFGPVPFGQYGLYLIPPDSIGAVGAPAVFVVPIPVDGEVIATPTVTVQRCIGTVRPRVIDQDSLPVGAINVTLYTATGAVSTLTTDGLGRVTFANLPCRNYGVGLNPAFGYTFTNQRGFGFQDGLGLSHQATLEPTLRATRL